MKKIVNITLNLIAIISLMACSPQEESARDLGSVIAKENIKVTATEDPNDASVFHFKLETPECVGVFTSAKADINEVGLEFTKTILWKGDYELNVKVYNKAGLSDSIKVPFTVRVTKAYQIIGGEANSPVGKTWRINGALSGHIGCGELNGNSNNFWSPAPYSLPAALYDDDIVLFNNANKSLTLKNKGASFMNESTASLFPDGDPTGSFVTTHYTPATNATWDAYLDDNGTWLTMTNAFPAYAVNPAAINGGKYKIVDISENSMHIVYNTDISWHYYLTSDPR